MRHEYDYDLFTIGKRPIGDGSTVTHMMHCPALAFVPPLARHAAKSTHTALPT